MAEKVRVGVVGTSWFADGFHLPNLASHPRAKITAICGRTRERAEALATKYTIPHVFTDYHAMIASGTLDALVVVTPDALHYPITMAALDAGLHVLCEKALSDAPITFIYGMRRTMGATPRTVGDLTAGKGMGF
jgi:predicted dehydrogenase